MRAALAQYPRIPGIGEPEPAMLFGNDETEEPQIAQPLNEFGGLLGFTIPALEILVLGSQKIIDGIDHHPQDLLVLIAQLRIREHLILQDVSGDEIFGDAHGGLYSATR